MENLRSDNTYREEENKRARESYDKAFEALSLKEDKKKAEHKRDADYIQKIHKICNVRQYCALRGEADGKGYYYHMKLYKCKLFMSDPKEAEKFCKENFLWSKCQKCSTYFDRNRCGKHPDGCLPSHCTLKCEECLEAQAYYFGPLKGWIDCMASWEEMRKIDPHFVELSHPTPEELAEGELVYFAKGGDKEQKKWVGWVPNDKRSGFEVIQSMYARYKEIPDWYEKWSKERPWFDYLCKEQDGNLSNGPAVKCHHPNWTCHELKEGKN